MKIKKALFFWLIGFSLLLFTTPQSLYAQQDRQMQERSPNEDVVKPEDVKRSTFRLILNKFTVGVNLGYGLNYYQQKLPYSVMRKGNQHYISPLDNSSIWYTDWLKNPQRDPLATNGTPDAIHSEDSASLRLKGFGHSLPLALDLHVVIMNRFRLGGGVGLEMFSIRPLEFVNSTDSLLQYQPGVNSALALRYYGMVGARVIRWGNWDHSVDVRLGKKNFLTKFDKGNVNESLLFNLGFTMERNYSEYFRLTLRPAVEWFSFTSRIGEERELKTSNPSLYLQAGVSFNYPLLPRCPIKACHIQLEHVHNGKEFRGQPIHKWQNPKYGQNHPELQRNLKRRNEDTEQQRQRRPKRRKHSPIFR